MIIAIIILSTLLLMAVSLALIFWLQWNLAHKDTIGLSMENERLKSLVSGLDNLCIELTREKRIALEEYHELVASYTVTESDMIKYDSDDEMVEHIDKGLLKTIVGDMLKKLDLSPKVRINDKGKTVYEYRFYVKQI